MMQPQPCSGNVPHDYFMQDKMEVTQESNDTPQGHGENWQTPSSHSVIPVKGEKMPPEDIQKNSNAQLESKAVMTPLPKNDSKKRNYEETSDDDRVVKTKSSTSQHNNASVVGKLDDQLDPQKRKSEDSRRHVTLIERKSSYTGAKYTSDGKLGFKAIECTPEGSDHDHSFEEPQDFTRSKIGTEKEFRDKKEELEHLIKLNPFHPNDDVVFKVCCLFLIPGICYLLCSLC